MELKAVQQVLLTLAGAENRVMGMQERRFSQRISFNYLVSALAAALVMLAISSCSSTRDLVLDDPAFLNEMVQGALEGEIFSVTPEDSPGIRRLLNNDSPEYRRAGLLLAAQSPDRSLRMDIVNATMDDNSDVASQARSIIALRPGIYRPLLLGLLEETNPAQRENALKLLGETGGEDLVPAFIRFFSDSVESVRNQASLSVLAVSGRDNPFLRSALESENPVVVAIAIRTIGRFGNPDDIPLFVEYFSHPDAAIRGEAQRAVFRFGPAALDALHRLAGSETADYRSRLSALEVIQGRRSPRSLPLLLSLLDDEDSRIRGKTGSILGTYGPEAVPALTELYFESAEANRVHAVTLMGEIRAPSAIPTLAEALGDSSVRVRNVATESLKLFGDTAYPVLRETVLSGNPDTGGAAMRILFQGRDGWLLRLADGKPNNAALFMLITGWPSDEIERYLNDISVPRLLSESILSLKQAWDIGEEFAALDNDIASGRDPYLYAWRQRELYSVDSRRKLRESFNELHSYFETRDAQALQASKALREESRQLEEAARNQKEYLDSLSEERKVVGERRLSRYREMRESLVRIWEYVVPEHRPLAEDVFADRGLNPQTLVRESALLN